MAKQRPKTNQIDPKAFIPGILADLKKTLPKTCTSLMAVRRGEEITIRATIAGRDIRYRTPENQIYTQQHVEVLRERILEDCNKASDVKA